jgi:hypothetical protein
VPRERGTEKRKALSLHIGGVAGFAGAAGIARPGTFAMRVQAVLSLIVAAEAGAGASERVVGGRRWTAAYTSAPPGTT